MNIAQTGAGLASQQPLASFEVDASLAADVASQWLAVVLAAGSVAEPARKLLVHAHLVPECGGLLGVQFVLLEQSQPPDENVGIPHPVKKDPTAHASWMLA